MSLMHAINSILGTNATQSLTGSAISAANMTTSTYGTLLGQAQAVKSTRSQTVFNGRINVEKVANGYVINIATREGYEFDTYIAATIQEVNERIAASMVSFQLENK